MKPTEGWILLIKIIILPAYFAVGLLLTFIGTISWLLTLGNHFITERMDRCWCFILLSHIEK